MAATVKILLEGYTNADAPGVTGEEFTRPTVTLVRDGELVIVVDPGIMESQKLLVDALALEGLTVDDVKVVVVTHSKLAHYRNVGMFPKARVLEYFGLWKGETIEAWPEQFSPYIRIIKTPGHEYTGITLLVTTEQGVVAICGDVFWRENFPKDPIDDLYATNPTQLSESRKMILQMADWIVPGHGPMFEVSSDSRLQRKNGQKKVKKLLAFCKKCKRPIVEAKETCTCRPWLCYRCCQCKLDCELCNCSHKVAHKKR